MLQEVSGSFNRKTNTVWKSIVADEDDVIKFAEKAAEVLGDEKVDPTQVRTLSVGEFGVLIYPENNYLTG